MVSFTVSTTWASRQCQLHLAALSFYKEPHLLEILLLLEKSSIQRHAYRRRSCSALASGFFGGLLAARQATSSEDAKTVQHAVPTFP